MFGSAENFAVDDFLAFSIVRSVFGIAVPRICGNCGSPAAVD
jgi:hypothetical protein